MDAGRAEDAPGVRVKVCGLTRGEDVALARDCGASWFGMILHPPSPRYVPDERVGELLAAIPEGRAVAVVVEPDARRLREIADMGFHHVQIHFDPGQWSPEARGENWPREGTVWLAPRLGPEAAFPGELLAQAHGVLVDAHAADRFGGTGKTADWARFRSLKDAFPQVDWILAGGLGPENVREAIRATGTRIVDLNSGVESQPGIKDAARLRQVFALLG